MEAVTCHLFSWCHVVTHSSLTKNSPEFSPSPFRLHTQNPTMSTRAGISATATRARETLMRLLFADRSVINERLSHAALKEAYLDRVHELHPDKNRQNDSSEFVTTSKLNARKFIELKNAWEEYDKIMKLNKLTNQSSEFGDDKTIEEASFTLFGVGCSFADSDSERDYRNEIMEQACRGWFSRGSLGTGRLDRRTKTSMFTDTGSTDWEGGVDSNDLTAETEIERNAAGGDSYTNDEVEKSAVRKSLVQDFEKFRKR
eukprot:scaffold98416_cov78-Cyclotella_meneghiniana.AAC.3